jgi:dGTPase
LAHEAVRRLINRMVNDLLAESSRRLADANPHSVADVRALDRPVIAFSDAMAENDKIVKAFLMKHLYRHERVNAMTEHAKQVVSALFQQYMNDPAALPDDWRVAAEEKDQLGRARIVADFIAGMTDRFALQEYERLIEGSGSTQ